MLTSAQFNKNEWIQRNRDHRHTQNLISARLVLSGLVTAPDCTRFHNLARFTMSWLCTPLFSWFLLICCKNASTRRASIHYLSRSNYLVSLSWLHCIKLNVHCTCCVGCIVLAIGTKSWHGSGCIHMLTIDAQYESSMEDSRLNLGALQWCSMGCRTSMLDGLSN